jgi:hypothetical protein
MIGMLERRIPSEWDAVGVKFQITRQFVLGYLKGVGVDGWTVNRIISGEFRQVVLPFCIVGLRLNGKGWWQMHAYRDDGIAFLLDLGIEDFKAVCLQESEVSNLY